MALHLQSSAFKEADRIPQKFAKEGDDVSPPLKWTGVPKGTKEFVLVCEDPDAPSQTPFIHWIAYKIPATCTEIPEGLPKKREVQSPVHVVQGKNSFGEIGYGGPMPPKKDKAHHYHFKLYALDTELPIELGIDEEELKKSMRGHILDKAEIVGLYQR